MPDESAVPRGPLLLGWAGVIPFAALAGAAVLGSDFLAALAARLLSAYAACILAFMGGAQWGLAMRPGEERGVFPYAVSVLPALWAFGCLVLPERAALAGLALGFALLLAYDLATVRQGLAPRWYRPLRWQLTAAVVAILLATALTRS